MITPQTPHPELAKALEVNSLYFKREDLHPLGSHKGRSIPVMIDKYFNEGIRHFAISSSGNAALAASLYIKKLNKNIQLDILVGQHISTKKLEKLKNLEDNSIKVTSHDRPIQTLFNITKDPLVKALRQSTDDNALIGYKELAEELLEIKDLKAVFIGTSSGTVAQALAEYFKLKNKKIEIHIVQTSSCHPMIDDVSIEELSIADAIVDHTAIRKEKILKLIENGWIATNEQIRTAQEITKKYIDLDISTNSALSVAGLMQAVYTGKKWNGSVVCMICGD
ncbi:MAG: PLP-dependent lyase/thiolase [Candidatus Taylorbacteria bacterium]|nr:PLP-dependent lyase/thiolase [Candidatus Taylorbacteria bacterium]